ncbi:MAG TPA: alpha/beta hydrolase fold domain-containing protein [Acidimicrobiales bacterium]|nr:alpha/beta hydrolase fold domain-containing protein [Acidimicrobiales bacterium]
MTLWPDEYEELRAEARALTPSVVEAMQLSGPPGEDRAARLARIRQGIAELVPASPDGVDENVGGVPCRVFHHPEPRATYLQIHGGAMMFGAARMDDVANLAISKDVGVTVVSVDYRLAPEDPFPAGADDCLAVAAALLDGGADRLLIGGESAGGTHAATTVLRIRDELGRIDRVAGVNFEYGLFDFGRTPSMRGVRPSDLGDVIGRDHDEVVDAYLPGRSLADLSDPACSPLYADLTGLPPALFTVGHADHLLDDNLFMAARWRAWGNQAELAVYPDCIHGFLRFPMALAERARDRITAFLDRCV